MRVTVLYFAILRERARLDREELELPSGADVAAARAAIAARHPQLAPLLPRVQAAVNRAMVPDARALSEGDELALIPPVAGGSDAPRVAISPYPVSLSDVAAVVEGPGRGGLVTLSGIVRRDGHALPDVIRLEYEAFTEMALEVLAAIADELER